MNKPEGLTEEEQRGFKPKRDTVTLQGRIQKG